MFMRVTTRHKKVEELNTLLRDSALIDWRLTSRFYRWKAISYSLTAASVRHCSSDLIPKSTSPYLLDCSISSIDSNTSKVLAISTSALIFLNNNGKILLLTYIAPSLILSSSSVISFPNSLATDGK